MSIASFSLAEHLSDLGTKTKIKNYIVFGFKSLEGD